MARERPSREQGQHTPSSEEEVGGEWRGREGVGDTQKQEEMARIEAIKRDWAGCVGKSDDVEVERLPWERMKKYYHPPRGTARRRSGRDRYFSNRQRKGSHPHP
jgi:hypothetical protein